MQSPIPHVCISASGNPKLFGAFFALILSNVASGSFNVVLLLGDCMANPQPLAGAMLGMLFVMYRRYRAYRSSLINTFYRDGIGYFVLLSGESRGFIEVTREADQQVYSFGSNKRDH